MRRQIHLPPHEKAVGAFLAAICTQIRHRKITRIRRSIGSVLLIDIGPMAQYLVENRRIRGGEWHLLVEMADWTIFRRGKEILNSGQEPKRIENGIEALKGRSIRQLVIRTNGQILFVTDRGIKLAIKKRYRRNYNQNWVLFYKNHWSLSNADNKDYFIFEIDTSDKLATSWPKS
jgi:hypothetical protein